MTSALLMLLSIMAAGFYAGTETGAYRLNRIRLHSDAARGAWGARLLQGLLADMERFVCMTLAGHNAAAYAATAVFTGIIAGYFTNELMAELVTTLVLAPVLLVFADVFPKSLFQVTPNWLLRVLSPLIWLSDKVFYPVVMLLRANVEVLRRLLVGRAAPRQTVVSVHYLSAMLAAGTQEGVITPQQDIMVRNILDLGHRPVSRIMTPLANVRMLPITASGKEVFEAISKSGHARLPVYDGHPWKIVGVLRTLDYLCEGNNGDFRRFMYQPPTLNERTTVDRAFHELQQTGNTMAIIADSRGRAVGILTKDDLLEAILRSLGPS